jgi:molybdopterin converting factor small subunit
VAIPAERAGTVTLDSVSILGAGLLPLAPPGGADAGRTIDAVEKVLMGVATEWLLNRGGVRATNIRASSKREFIMRLVIIAATLVGLSAANAQQPKAAVPTSAVKQEFDGFIQKFRGALKANDVIAVAAMTRLPYQGDEAIRTVDQFRAKIYKSYFTAKNRACLQSGKTVYDPDDYKNDAYAVSCGDDIFVFTKTSSGFLFTDISVND